MSLDKRSGDFFDWVCQDYSNTRDYSDSAATLSMKPCLREGEEAFDPSEKRAFVGVSLANRFFSSENLFSYFTWMLETTRKDILVVVADAIFAINVEALEGKDVQYARRNALQLGDIRELQIHDAIVSLPENVRDMVHVVRWQTIVSHPHYQGNYEVIRSAFKDVPSFFSRVMSILDDILKSKSSRKTKGISDDDRLYAAEYILHELAAFCSGFVHDGQIYDLCLYPYPSDIWFLVRDLQDGQSYPQITEKLHLDKENPIALGILNTPGVSNGSLRKRRQKIVKAVSGQDERLRQRLHISPQARENDDHIFQVILDFLDETSKSLERGENVQIKARVFAAAPEHGDHVDSNMITGFTPKKSGNSKDTLHLRLRSPHAEGEASRELHRFLETVFGMKITMIDSKPIRSKKTLTLSKYDASEALQDVDWLTVKKHMSDVGLLELDDGAVMTAA